MARRADQVFLNVPFDHRYQKLLDALVFAVHESGPVARCALEKDDGGQVRIEKLYDIIRDCRLGIHDLSRTTLDSAPRPRSCERMAAREHLWQARSWSCGIGISLHPVQAAVAIHVQA